MELDKLTGTIIGVVKAPTFNNTNYLDKTVKELIGNKLTEALKIVNLPKEIASEQFRNLSINDQKKVILASKLNAKVIILEDFFQGMTFKEVHFYKNLLKKISTYQKKIILISNFVDDFFNFVDMVYVFKNDEIVFQTSDLKNEKLYAYVKRPPIIEFVYLTRQKGIKLDYYTEFNDLLKAIYRLKS